ncbi:MAG: hypothetical protein QW423_00335 [Candidatus Aenigmatarchaeota archaeon]
MRFIINLFIKLLKEIKLKSKEINNFSGMGLILYNSRYFSNIPHFSLRPMYKLPKNKINIKNSSAIDFLLKISRKNNTLHDGFHFINETGDLTHVSQYFVPPIRKIKINKSQGVRYHAALLGSYIKGIILVGILTADKKTYYFKKGKVYKV